MIYNDKETEIFEDFKDFWKKYEIKDEDKIEQLLGENRDDWIDKYLHPDDFKHLKDFLGEDNFKKLVGSDKISLKKCHFDSETKKELFRAFRDVFLPFRENNQFGLPSVIRGDVEKSKIVLLLNNPGMDEIKNRNCTAKVYSKAIQNTIDLSPNITWDKYIADDWYSKSIHGVACNPDYVIQSESAITADDILVIEYFPYPTVKFAKLKEFFMNFDEELPSQKRTKSMIKYLAKDKNRIFICRKNGIELFKKILDEDTVKNRLYHFSSDYVRLRYSNIAKYTDVKNDFAKMFRIDL